MSQDGEPQQHRSAKTGDIDLGRRVVARRGELGLSRKELATAVGISYPYLSQIETGYRLPSAKHQLALSSALGLSLDELFDHRVPMSPALEMNSATHGFSTGTRRRQTLDEAVDRATLELESLPLTVRLEALSRVQLRIMRGVAGSPTEQQS